MVIIRNICVICIWTWMILDVSAWNYVVSIFIVSIRIQGVSSQPIVGWVPLRQDYGKIMAWLPYWIYLTITVLTPTLWMSGMVPSRHRKRTQACAERVCAKMYAWMICSVYDVYGFRSYRLLRHLGPECTQESHASGSHWARNLFAACTGRWVGHGGFLRSWDNKTCLC